MIALIVCCRSNNRYDLFLLHANRSGVIIW